jgi:D-inositol-3-phosphate glycosyltransferase
MTAVHGAGNLSWGAVGDIIRADPSVVNGAPALAAARPARYDFGRDVSPSFVASSGMSAAAWPVEARRPRAPGLDALLPPARRVAMLSVHTCPLAAPGGKETGGMNVYVRELSRELGRRGIEVDCFTRSQSSLVPHIPDADLGPSVRLIHVVAGPEAPLSKAQTWATLPQFVAGVRAFMASHEATYDLYHSHYWMSGWVVRQLAAVRPAPIVQMFHTLGAMKDLSGRRDQAPEIEPRRLVERELMAAVDRIVAATEVDRTHMVELYGADRSKIQVIPPGVDLGLFRPIPREVARAHLGDGPEHRMILYVGRFDPVKGLDTLVQAIAQVIAAEPEFRRNACLCLIGGDRSDDPALANAEMRRIDALRHELGLSDFVTFLGPLSQEELPYFYSAAEVVVVPSRYETFGLVALEAMACGAPVIATDVGGLSTLVRPGRTGFLVPEGDVAALAAELLLLIRHPELGREMGRHAVATAEAYGWPTIAERVEALYEEVLREPAAVPV